MLSCSIGGPWLRNKATRVQGYSSKQKCFCKLAEVFWELARERKVTFFIDRTQLIV